MVEIKVENGQAGDEIVGEYINRYWDHAGADSCIISCATSRDGVNYEQRNEVAYPTGLRDVEFLYDWWEGEKFIRIFGIKNIRDIEILGGIYEE